MVTHGARTGVVQYPPFFFHRQRERLDAPSLGAAGLFFFFNFMCMRLFLWVLAVSRTVDCQPLAAYSIFECMCDYHIIIFECMCDYHIIRVCAHTLSASRRVSLTPYNRSLLPYSRALLTLTHMHSSGALVCVGAYHLLLVYVGGVN